jgi:hypothetical protein
MLIGIDGSKMSTCDPKSGAGPGEPDVPPHVGVVVQLGGQPLPPPVEPSLVVDASAGPDASPLPDGPESGGVDDESCTPPPASGHQSLVLFAELEQPSANTKADAVAGRRTLMDLASTLRRNQQELCRDGRI